jgi:N-acetyl-anhydromuramyl-L-alanine amidase AmpD
MLFSTNPLPIIDHPADRAHCCGEARLGYRWIFLHATGGVNSLNWLSTTSPHDTPVSCHRLIAKDGTIYKIVPDDKVAYTQGPSVAGPVPGNGENMNQWALSIEMENLDNGHDPYPVTQVRACALQVVEWIGAYGFIPIVAHAWMQRDKHDPLGFPWDELYALIWDQLKEIARR